MRDLAVHESGVAIDLAAPDAIGEALLRQLLAERERTGKPLPRGVLCCDTHGSPLYLQVRRSNVYACHFPGFGGSDHPVALMSVEHRMQTEYVARAADRAGLETKFEAPLRTHVRPDLVIAGDTAVEVQRAHLTVAAAKARTTKAVKGGMKLSLWISDKEPQYAPGWLGKVPSVRAFARDWATMPPMGAATVMGGVRELSAEPCRPPHRWQCPEDDGRYCGKFHVIHRPLPGVTLDSLAVDVATGLFVPAEVRGLVVLARESEVRRYDLGWQPPALKVKQKRLGRQDRVECRAQPTEVMCCGERPPGVANEPLVVACQLCPKSPTYWRRAS